MIVIAYDGSPDAKAAIEFAAAFVRDEPATVVTVWESFGDVIARTGGGFGVAPEAFEFQAIDAANQRAARERAEEGAQQAIRGGLDAQARCRMQESTVAAAIIAEAEDLEARAIVVGTRGLTGIKSLMLGSVSHAILHHAARPVLVVPSPEVARARAGRQS